MTAQNRSFDARWVQLPSLITRARTVALRSILASGILAAIMAPAVLHGQGTPVPPYAEQIKLSGPRFGITFLDAGVRDKIAEETGDSVSALISQFGWQWERQLNAGDTGPVAVTELVLLVGGLEQGTFLPSLSWLVGLRTRNGTEFGVGPNFTAAGTAIALAGGVTQRAGSLNIPVNLSVVPSKSGIRVSVLTGFTIR